MMTRFDFYPVDRRRELETRVAEYTFEQTEPTPWTPLRRRLKECNVSVVTTAGIRLATQHQFATDLEKGSPEFREISSYVESKNLAFDFTNYDPSEAHKDINVLVPMAALQEMVDEKKIAGMGETFYSIFGPCEDTDALKQTADVLAGKLKNQDIDVVLVFTANLVCNQSGSTMARELERRGLTTLLLATVREITEQVRAPRTAFINFPFGRPLGRAGDRAMQRSILDEMTTGLLKLQRPGKIIDLPMKWDGILE